MPCPVITRSGECGKPIPPDLHYVCRKHQRLEAEVLHPRICAACLQPMPPRTGSPSFCGRKCSLRYHQEKLGFASLGPPCPRCGNKKTYLTVGLDYQCEMCGYCSDMPERTGGFIAGQKRKLPAAFADSQQPTRWGAELRARMGTEGGYDDAENAA